MKGQIENTTSAVWRSGTSQGQFWKGNFLANFVHRWLNLLPKFIKFLPRGIFSSNGEILFAHVHTLVMGSKHNFVNRMTHLTRQLVQLQSACQRDYLIISFNLTRNYRQRLRRNRRLKLRFQMVLSLVADEFYTVKVVWARQRPIFSSNGEILLSWNPE